MAGYNTASNLYDEEKPEPYSTAQNPYQPYQNTNPNYQAHTTQENWKSTLQGIGGIAGAAGHSNMARSTAGRAVLGNSLQDEAMNARAQSDQLKSRLAELEYFLFEPSPANAVQGVDMKDNPSTVEGNIQHTSRSLASATLTLERIISKIGGR